MTKDLIASYALAMAPTVLAVLIGILINNARLGDLRIYLDGRLTDNNINLRELRSDLIARFNEVDRRFDQIDKRMDQRFDDAKATWRAELHRVEEVLDARLKHLEER